MFFLLVSVIVLGGGLLVRLYCWWGGWITGLHNPSILGKTGAMDI